jgi:hypothetical protein
MDSEKLGDKSMIEIIDLARLNQASQIIILNKNSEMYRDMSQDDFDKKLRS